MYLVDSNVWLELLLERNKEEESRRFFENIDAEQIAITEFSLYSIGIILTKLNKDEIFIDFISDTLQDSEITLIRLGYNELIQMQNIRKQFNLDFDDIYQYYSAIKYNFQLVSFDADFDRTKLGRKTPSEILDSMGL